MKLAKFGVLPWWRIVWIGMWMTENSETKMKSLIYAIENESDKNEAKKNAILRKYEIGWLRTMGKTMKAWEDASACKQTWLLAIRECYFSFRYLPQKYRWIDWK